MAARNERRAGAGVAQARERGLARGVTIVNSLEGEGAAGSGEKRPMVPEDGTEPPPAKRAPADDGE